MSTIKMDPKVKSKWVKALRSGKYKKGKYQLVTPPTKEGGDYAFCCLGVLEDLAVKEGISEWSEHYYDHGWPFDDSSISDETRDWAFGKDRIVDLLGQGVLDFLINKNDGSGVPKPWTHKRIADWIEKNL